MLLCYLSIFDFFYNLSVRNVPQITGNTGTSSDLGPHSQIVCMYMRLAESPKHRGKVKGVDV